MSLNVPVTWVLCDRRNNTIESCVSVFSGIANMSVANKPMDTTADERGHLFGDIAARVHILALNAETIAAQELRVDEVLLYPMRQGDPLPETTWNDKGDAITLKTGNQTDLISLKPGKNGCTSVTVSRDGMEQLTLP